MNKTSVAVVKSSNFGASLCIDNPSELSTSLIPSIASPTTLNKRPLIFSPIGILIPVPVERTSIPLVKPSVESIEMVLTAFSPT